MCGMTPRIREATAGDWLAIWPIVREVVVDAVTSEAARDMHAAFTSAGGVADLQQLASYGEDGHRLFPGAGGSLIWGPLIEHYLASQQVGTP